MERKYTKVTKKEIAREVGHDIVRATKSGTSGLAKLVCKASYPIAGNLSNNIQTKIENLLGREYYDAEQAYDTSLLTNISLYGISGGGLVGYFMDKNLSESPTLHGLTIIPSMFLVGYICAAGLGGYEFTCREKKRKKRDSKVSASLLGKAVSFPFDFATYCYDGAKNYLDNVSERISKRGGNKK